MKIIKAVCIVADKSLSLRYISYRKLLKHENLKDHCIGSCGHAFSVGPLHAVGLFAALHFVA